MILFKAIQRLRKTICALTAFGLVAGLLFCSGPAVAAGTIQIHLRANARVNDESIRLGDIADVRSDNVDLSRRLRNIDVGRAPLPGQSLLIHRGQVEMRLRQNDIDPDSCRIILQGPVKVLRKHATVAAGQIRSAVRAYINAHAPWAADQMKIRPIRYDRDHVLPCGSAILRVTAPKHTDWLGAIPFKVEIQVNGRTVKRTSVATYIEVRQDVVVAAKPLGRNQPITPADVRTQNMNLARVPANAVLRPDQVIGQRADRSIAVNSVLRADQIYSPPVIRKGDTVQVLAESNHLKITTQAIAQEDGGTGDNIRVMNIASRKKIHARVIDSQTVRVDF